MSDAGATEEKSTKKTIVLVGAGGSGKDFARQQLCSDEYGYKSCVSTTTRAARPGEVDGRDYHYVTKAEFEAFLAAGDLMEHDFFADNYYGLQKRHFVESGGVVILTPTGLAKMGPELRAHLFVIYLDIDEGTRRTRLAERMKKGRNSPEVDTRIGVDLGVFLDFDDYDMYVCNPHFKVKELHHIIKVMEFYNDEAEPCRSRRVAVQQEIYGFFEFMPRSGITSSLIEPSSSSCVQPTLPDSS